MGGTDRRKTAIVIVPHRLRTKWRDAFRFDEHRSRAPRRRRSRFSTAKELEAFVLAPTDTRSSSRPTALLPYCRAQKQQPRALDGLGSNEWRPRGPRTVPDDRGRGASLATRHVQGYARSRRFPFCQGLPSALPIPSSTIQLRIAFETNSGLRVRVHGRTRARRRAPATPSAGLTQTHERVQKGRGSSRTARPAVIVSLSGVTEPSKWTRDPLNVTV